MNAWQPVYNTGCGWRECPECGPLIELEIEAEHQAVSSRTWPEPNWASEWLADLYGTGAEREIIAEERKEARREARSASLTARERARVRRVLTPEQRTKAFAQVDAYPLRKSYLDDAGAKREWLSEVWLELENPTVKVASKESRFGLDRRVKRAIKRAQHRIDRERAKTNRAASSLND